MKLTVRPLTPDLWAALEDLFGENAAVGDCWCMYWRIGRAYRKRQHEENRAAFRGAETKAWMRGSSPRKTTWGVM